MSRVPSRNAPKPTQSLISCFFGDLLRAQKASNLLCYVAIIFTLVGCTPSTNSQTFITTCTEPACDSTASLTDQNFKSVDGFSVVFNATLQAIINKPIEKLIQQGDVIIVSFEGDASLSASQINIESLALTNSDVTMKTFLDWVFMKDFASLLDSNPNDDLLASVRDFKLQSFNSRLPRYFYLGDVKVFYYMIDENKYQILMPNSNNDNFAILMDVNGFTQKDLIEFISTFKPYSH